jgi:hypothetical protein
MADAEKSLVVLLLLVSIFHLQNQALETVFSTNPNIKNGFQSIFLGYLVDETGLHRVLFNPGPGPHDP